MPSKGILLTVKNGYCFSRVLKVLNANTSDKFIVAKNGDYHYNLYYNGKLLTDSGPYDDEDIERRLMTIARERGLTPLSVWE